MFNDTPARKSIGYWVSEQGGWYIHACMHIHKCTCMHTYRARCSSLVQCPLMVWWFVRSIPSGGPIHRSLISYSCIKGHGMYYPVCVMMHIKEPLLLTGNSSQISSGTGNPLSLSDWFFSICPMRKLNTASNLVLKT